MAGRERKNGYRRAACRMATAVILGAVLTGCSTADPLQAQQPDALSRTPSATPAASASLSADPAKLDGALFYLGSGFLSALRSDTVSVVADYRSDKTLCKEKSLTVSPDGKRLAWVLTDSGADIEMGSIGRLVIADLDGSHEQEVADRVVCAPPRWSPDSRLMSFDSSGGRRTVDVATLKPGEAVPDGTHRSPDGRLVVGSAKKGYEVRTADGALVRTFSMDVLRNDPRSERVDVWGIRALSLDGRYVAVEPNPTDNQRGPDGNDTVIDTTTGKLVVIPVKGIMKIMFLPDGRTLVRSAGMLTLFSASFKKLAVLTEPKQLRDSFLLTYGV